MEESRICRIGVKADMLRNSQPKDHLQCHDSNPVGTSNKHSLEEKESSDFIAKNRSLVSPLYSTQESREEPSGPEAGTDPSDSQQDSECNKNKGKTLGKNLCSVVGHFYMLLISLIFLAVQVIMEHSQF